MAVYFTLFRNETDCAKGNCTVLGYIKGKLPCKINTFWIDVAQVSENLGDLPQFFQHVLNKWEILKTTILASEVWPQESPLKRGIIQCDVNKDRSFSASKNSFNKHLASRNLH